MAEKAADAAETAKKNYSRELANLQTQISILKSRLEAEKTAREEINNSKKNGDKANPFASVDGKEDAPEDREQKLSDEYAIMEISGQGNELAAKLINKKRLILYGTERHCLAKRAYCRRNYADLYPRRQKRL